MSRLLQIFTNRLSCKTLLRVYCKTGCKYDWLKQAALSRGKSKLYSIVDEDDIVTQDWIMQVNKIDEDGQYSIAIHTSLTYILVHVQKTTKKAYSGNVVEVITSDLDDYNRICTTLIPSLFVEFIAYSLDITESPKCNYVVSKFVTQSQRTR